MKRGLSSGTREFSALENTPNASSRCNLTKYGKAGFHPQQCGFPRHEYVVRSKVSLGQRHPLLPCPESSEQVPVVGLEGERLETYKLVDFSLSVVRRYFVVELNSTLLTAVRRFVDFFKPLTRSYMDVSACAGATEQCTVWLHGMTILG